MFIKFEEGNVFKAIVNGTIHENVVGAEMPGKDAPFWTIALENGTVLLATGEVTLFAEASEIRDDEDTVLYKRDEFVYVCRNKVKK